MPMASVMSMAVAAAAVVGYLFNTYIYNITYATAVDERDRNKNVGKGKRFSNMGEAGALFAGLNFGGGVGGGEGDGCSPQRWEWMWMWMWMCVVMGSIIDTLLVLELRPPNGGW